MRVRRGASCRGILREAGQRCGCRPAIRKSLEAPGRHRPIPATSISSAPSISIPHMQTCTAILTAHRAPIIRMHGQPRATMQQLAQLEAVVGPYGGQLASFEWVFSPRGPDGRPAPLFDRVTGEIDPTVAGLLARSLRHRPKTEQRLENHRPRPPGKDSPHRGHRRHLLPGWSRAQSAVRARPPWRQGKFTFLPGRSHFDLYHVGDDRFGLFDRIAAEMYRVARPQFTPTDRDTPVDIAKETMVVSLVYPKERPWAAINPRFCRERWI